MSPVRRPSDRGLRTAAAQPAKDVLAETIVRTPDNAFADQPKPEKWPARISMTASREMKRELEAARLDDGIEVTARLRALIRLWQTDPELRGRADELAKTLR